MFKEGISCAKKQYSILSMVGFLIIYLGVINCIFGFISTNILCMSLHTSVNKNNTRNNVLIQKCNFKNVQLHFIYSFLEWNNNAWDILDWPFYTKMFIYPLVWSCCLPSHCHLPTRGSMVLNQIVFSFGHLNCQTSACSASNVWLIHWLYGMPYFSGCLMFKCSYWQWL